MNTNKEELILIDSNEATVILREVAHMCNSKDIEKMFIHDLGGWAKPCRVTPRQNYRF